MNKAIRSRDCCLETHHGLEKKCVNLRQTTFSSTVHSLHREWKDLRLLNLYTLRVTPQDDPSSILSLLFSDDIPVDRELQPEYSWLQLPSLLLVMSPNCRLKFIWAVALTGAASRKPLIEGSTAVTRNMRGCTSLERRPLSNCWTKRQRFCLTKCHPSNPTFRISCSKMERALLSWELSEREGLLTPSVGARRCLCVQQSCLRQVDGLRVLGLSHQFSRAWAAKVCLSCWDRT